MLRRGADIAERMTQLGLVALQVSAELPRHPAGRHIGLQLVRSVTGAGANYEEARAAESRDDFVHKVSIAAKEMREGRYWLALLERSSWLKMSLQAAIMEAEELAAILGASARTARSRGA
jgi:four helix bundle protein